MPSLREGRRCVEVTTMCINSLVYSILPISCETDSGPDAYDFHLADGELTVQYIRMY